SGYSAVTPASRNSPMNRKKGGGVRGGEVFLPDSPFPIADSQGWGGAAGDDCRFPGGREAVERSALTTAPPNAPPPPHPRDPARSHLPARIPRARGTSARPARQ